MIASVDWGDVAYAALAVFLVLTGLAIAYAAIRLGGTLGRASSLIEGTETELLPVISKLGGTLDRVNTQLDKVDTITDSAVDAVTTVDTGVRTITGAIIRPVQTIVGFFSGTRHAASSVRAGAGWRQAVQTGREEAARRERDLAAELDTDRPS
jgi:phage-related protein